MAYGSSVDTLNQDVTILTEFYSVPYSLRV
jgi:hypothetical protein